ncbi:hypothetical protein SASPL_144229 [Salvia splendens]|uniref:Uncharacterized protein n=1 Tax=Salvia splendens TaxID=180675 RepID=A0A8X8ZAS7_SALSN|nr:hypothetical protein SASPL_144229 [Salvia splendens]
MWKAQEFGVTEHDGIEKLIELLPDSWKEWAERTARRYTWHEPVTDDMVGDMAGFRKAVYCALVDSREEQPPQDVQERIVYQDKYVSMYEGEQGFEDDYEEEPEEAPQGNPEEAPQGNPEEAQQEKRRWDGDQAQYGGKRPQHMRNPPYNGGRQNTFQPRANFPPRNPQCGRCFKYHTESVETLGASTVVEVGITSEIAQIRTWERERDRTS